MLNVTILLLLISSLAQMGAASVAIYLAIRARAYRWAWLAMALATVLIVLIRLDPLELAVSTGIYDFFSALVGTLISLFMLLGFLGLRHVLRLLDAQGKQLGRLAVTDSLTGLFNRRHTLERGAAEMVRAGRHGSSLSLLLVDLDHFKRVNERHGAVAGDAVLVAVADALRAGLRQVDVLGRIGSVEFLLILPDTDTAGATVIAERLCARISQLAIVLQSGRQLAIAANIGGAVWKSGAHDAEDAFRQLLGQADTALSVAKQRGRNCVEFWTSEMVVQAS